jgi:hypothetical protein
MNTGNNRRPSMLEKYDLKEMLDEIAEDEAIASGSKDVKVSQDEIKKLLAKKRKGEKP